MVGGAVASDEASRPSNEANCALPYTSRRYTLSCCLGGGGIAGRLLQGHQLCGGFYAKDRQTFVAKQTDLLQHGCLVPINVFVLQLVIAKFYDGNQSNLNAL